MSESLLEKKMPSIDKAAPWSEFLVVGWPQSMNIMGWNWEKRTTYLTNTEGIIVKVSDQAEGKKKEQEDKKGDS